MGDFDKSKKDLIQELVEMRRQTSSLEKQLAGAGLFETAFSESEARYRGLIDNMPIVCFTFDRDGRIESWNWAAERVYGYSREEAIGQTLFDLIVTPETLEATQNVLRGIFRGESFVGLKWNDRNRKGEIGWRIGNAFPRLSGNEVEAGVSLVIDITTQELAVASMQKSEEKYRDLVEHSGSLILRIDTHGCITFLNEFARRFFGFTRKEILGRSALETILPLQDSAGADMRTYLEDLCRNPRVHAVSEVENVKKDGERAWVLWTNRAVTDDHGNVTHIFSIGQDITLRRRAEDQLRKLSHAVEQSPGTIMITGPEGEIEYVNPRFCELTGYRPEEVLGRNPRLFKSGEHSDEFYSRLWTQLTAGGQWRGEFRNRKKNGELYWEAASIAPVLNERGEITNFVKVAEDRTRIRNLEEQLELRQRMDSLGTLAGGIAHDFNNLLTGIMGNLSLLEMNKTELPDTPREHLEEAVRCCRRAADLIRQFQALSRGVNSVPVRVDVHQIASEVFKLLGETTDRLIEKRLEIPPGEFFVWTDPTELHQVFLNLGTNAVQAVTERGVRQGDFISLAASLRTGAGSGEPAGMPEGRYAHLVFSDSGVGMSAETRRRAFEPLFTTRGKEKRGQGLGLFMVYNIICNKNNGFIEVESKPGRGAAFHIYLPEAGQCAAVPRAAVLEGEVKGGTETVLVVEDEVLVRSLAVRVLHAFGYQVLAAVDGQEGLETFVRERRSIDLVLLDLVMPRMSGAMVLAKILELEPDMRVIISSGYSDEASRGGSLARAKAFLSKPYQAEDLARAVRSVLDKA